MKTIVGIVPYYKEKTLHILLGKQKDYWSGFIGHLEPTDNSRLDGALREFNEETALIFSNQIKPLRDFIVVNKIMPHVTVHEDKIIYIWIVHFKKELLLNLDFLKSRNELTNHIYKEKSEIKIFQMEEIIKNHNNIFLNSFRNLIINQYTKLKNNNDLVFS
jgi:8-oxo-dGTP pyrophosphatase MutT (NUDIX family)